MWDEDWRPGRASVSGDRYELEGTGEGVGPGPGQGALNLASPTFLHTLIPV